MDCSGLPKIRRASELWRLKEKTKKEKKKGQKKAFFKNALDIVVWVLLSMYKYLLFPVLFHSSTAQWLLYVPPGLTFSSSAFCPHSVFMCFVWIWEQTAIISLYSINWLVCITDTECVYCAVRTGSLYIILRSAHTVYLCVLCGSGNKQRLFPYTALTDWFV